MKKIQSTADVSNSCGITGIRNRPRSLGFPSDAPPNQAWVYGLANPFQISPTEAGIFVNIGRKDLMASGKGDLEAGNDLIIFNDQDKIGTTPPIPLNRGGETKDPRTGERVLMSSYPMGVGFVPHGAKRPDGSPHPYAGTGFGLLIEIGYPLERPGGPENDPDKMFKRWTLYQYRYDGKKFQITKSEELDINQFVPGHVLLSKSFTSAIPDGDDLLLPMSTVAEVPSEAYLKRSVTGIARWRYDHKAGWKICEYHPVPGALSFGEASVVRDWDGSLLFSARSFVEPFLESIVVWRSEDQGVTWEEVIHVKSARFGPVTINRAVDGSLYIVANPINKPASSPNALGKRDYVREALQLWMLAPDRRSLLTPVVVRDGHVEWGLTSRGFIRSLDHPSGRTVRLADGQWHHLLGYRVLGPWEVLVGTDLAATPIPGTYLDEIFSRGEPAPEWNF